MLRLGHRILSQQTVLPNILNPKASELYLGKYAMLQKLLAAPVCHFIIADNVARYYAETPRQTWGLTGKNYPCISPPFETGWFIEYNEPKELVGPKGKIIQTNRRGPQQGGALFANAPLESARRIFSDYGANLVDVDALISKSKWFYIIQHFLSTPSGNVVYMPLVHGVFVAPNGEFVNAMLFSDFVDSSSASAETWGDMMASCLHIPLLTLGFMHIKNSERWDVTKEEGPPSKWCRRQRVPEKKYTAVYVDPEIRGYRHGERKTEGDRSGKSLHICRGHFAHYVNDGISKGLFGRGIYGIFWIPAHSRGSLKKGSIVSTYKVKVPKC